MDYLVCVAKLLLKLLLITYPNITHYEYLLKRSNTAPPREAQPVDSIPRGRGQCVGGPRLLQGLNTSCGGQGYQDSRTDIIMKQKKVKISAN